MVKKTNLEQVKNVARNFLYLDINVNEQFPFIARHPYIDTPFFVHENKIYNLSDDEDGLELFINEMEKRISEVNSYIEFEYLLTKPYKSAFLSYTKKYIDKYDLAAYLKALWISTETVNVDVNISKIEYIRLFKAADRETLMQPEEREFFDRLPDELTIYRGINTVSNHPVNGLSWTPDLDTATWFAERFQHGGMVYTARIKKTDILAYFNYEKETVVDFRKLENVKPL